MGNSFDNGPAPPPPPYLPPPSARSHKRNRTHPSSGSPNGSDVTYPSRAERGDKGLPSGAMVGVIVGSTSVGLLALLLLIFCIWQNMKTKMYKTSSLDGSRTSGPSVKHTGIYVVYMVVFFFESNFSLWYTYSPFFFINCQLTLHDSYVLYICMLP